MKEYNKENENRIPQTLLLYVCSDSMGNLRAFDDILDVGKFIEKDGAILVAHYSLSFVTHLKKEVTYHLVSEEKEK